MNKLKFLFAVISIVLAVTVILACSDGGDPEEELSGSTSQPTLPNNSIHPTSADYLVGDGDIDIKELFVKVVTSVSDTITYQWYEGTSFSNSGGTAIPDETADTYLPELGEAGTVKYYYVVVTYGNRVLASHPARIRFLSETAAASSVTVNISNTSAQYVRGFGGMSNAFGINPPGVARYMQLRDIDTMFHPETGLGFNILRIKIWYQGLEQVIAGDVDPQMGNQVYYDIVKRVNGYGGYVLASPWTPPPEWKLNGSEAGEGDSNLKPAHYTDYSEYLADFARAMARANAPIYSLSIQNEWTYPADYEGCLWTDQQNVDFLLRVGNFLNGVPGYGGGSNIPQVKLMSAEPHQQVTRNNSVRDNVTTNALINIYAYHTYGTHTNAYREVQADTANMRKEVWMTEFNINSGRNLEAQDYTWNFVWTFADHLDNNIRTCDANAYVWWYLKRYYCMIGDNAYGTINNQVLPRGYIMSHWAKYATDTVRAPATVIGHPGTGNTSDGSNTGWNSAVNVKASAFRRKAQPVSYWEQQVQKREDSVSLVIYDKRTGANAEGQNIRINLPSDFEATYAHGIISDNNRKHAPALVTLATDGKTADIYLPANSIMSIIFTKVE
jgi:O-glycosyl hydrolase